MWSSIVGLTKPKSNAKPKAKAFAPKRDYDAGSGGRRPKPFTIADIAPVADAGCLPCSSI
jgi:hypothetical protein